MDFPKEILEIGKRANERYPEDIKKATRSATRSILRLPDFAATWPNMSRRMKTCLRILFRKLIEDLRCRKTRQLKVKIEHELDPDQQDDRGTTERRPSRETTVVGASRAANAAAFAAAASAIREFAIGGRTLGCVRGEELEALEEGEKAVGGGHFLNAFLCKRLREFVGRRERVGSTNDRTLVATYKAAQRDVVRLQTRA